MLRFLSRFVGRKVLDQIYKMFVRPHLDYGDFIYQYQVKVSMDILEAIQYKAGQVLLSRCPGRVYIDPNYLKSFDGRVYMIAVIIAVLCYITKLTPT